jgi:hypothetical protein
MRPMREPLDAQEIVRQRQPERVPMLPLLSGYQVEGTTERRDA